ncbi:hypothetical protein [Nonomuraea candida]|uniref:hypothetical protein n=1 Tax=Nonomuraea candida TaxID=359159 RepID=UPI0005B8E311|nr:hypothetical protein [Nonomuraea candida]
MLAIDVYVPKGVLNEEERQALGRRLIDALMQEDDSHAVEVLDAQRLITQVLVHEPATWVLGRRPAADPADPPRYLVRVTVPASWRKEMCEYAVTIVTDALAETERAAGRDPERLRREPHAVVLLDGVAEGGIGFFGKVMSSMDLTEFVSRDYRDREPDPVTRTRAHEQRAQEREQLIDPICGMGVELDDSTLTLVHNGTLYGFCHGLCRRAFADEHGLPLGREHSPAE